MTLPLPGIALAWSMTGDGTLVARDAAGEEVGFVAWSGAHFFARSKKGNRALGIFNVQEQAKEAVVAAARGWAA